jgi:hypothetical protein
MLEHKTFDLLKFEEASNTKNIILNASWYGHFVNLNSPSIQGQD